MSYAITQESFDSLTAYYHANPGYNVRWDWVFVLPDWLRVWWQSFGSGAELYLGAVRQDDRIIGIAPLQIRNGTASIIGSADVCDYLDFVIAPAMGKDFFTALLDDLARKGVKQLDLASLRPDSAVLTDLVPMAQKRKYEASCHPQDVSVELDLPGTWEEYLEVLDRKQRHEVRRKLRRLLEEAGDFTYHVMEDSEAVHGAMDTFVKLFSESRQDKADFMTPQRESFFRAMADAMALAGVLKLGVLELDKRPAAMVMYFDYQDCVYLYNSGYDPDYSSLSVGVISKVLCIKDSIEKGKKKFDFLKGAEPYKYYLGGREVPLRRCQITISEPGGKADDSELSKSSCAQCS